jgi:hypothetical protein
MTTIITSLPTHDNNGLTTIPQLAITIALLRAGKVKIVNRNNGCRGIWYGDDGTEYIDNTVELTLDGPLGAIRTALAYFGIYAEQEAVLCAPYAYGKFKSVGYGEDDWKAFAKRYGGATIRSDGTCYSVEYIALERGKDYDFVDELVH